MRGTELLDATAERLAEKLRGESIGAEAWRSPARMLRIRDWGGCISPQATATGPQPRRSAPALMLRGWSLLPTVAPGARLAYTELLDAL